MALPTSQTRRPGRAQLAAMRLCTAIRFLTIVPISWKVEADGDNFGPSLVYFPLVGVIIGGLGAAGAYLLLMLFPLTVVAVIAIIYLAFISGCLHLDGLADSADGLFSSRPRQQSLKIMKDSRVGAMGVVVLIFLLLGKYTALSGLEPAEFCTALFVMPVCGRCAILFTMATVGYARPEGGLGSLFYSDFGRRGVLVTALCFGLLPVLFGQPRAILSLGMVLTAIVLFNRICVKKFGGATGDTLGAGCEIAELMVALSFAASLSTAV